MSSAPARARHLLGGVAVFSLMSAGSALAQDKPNILLILADDLGYSDIGAFGSEISTPNLDQLARDGMVLTNFHAGPVCNITRLQLMSGIDNNVATDPQGATAASRTALRHDALTIAEALDAAGYQSFMAGKWDLGQREDQWPAARGFDESFALLPGTASHYDEPPLAKRQPVYAENDRHLEDIPDTFFSTTEYTDRMLDFLKSSEGDNQPFFAYLAYTAPHFPVQAPEPYIAKYDGVYDAGYDAIRTARLERMKASGILPQDFADSPPPPDTIAWEAWPSAEEQRLEARRMQVYAAMIDQMDEEIGRVIDQLRDSGELDNTLIVFTSDNGATSGWQPPVFVDYGTGSVDNSFDNLGQPGSYMTPGNGWAWVSGAPFKMYKDRPEEGGHSVPAIAVLPGTIAQGSRSDAYSGVRDLLPTFLDLAGSPLPETAPNGEPSLPLDGLSILPVLSGEQTDSPYKGQAVGFRNAETHYLYLDSWKIQRAAGGDWQLHDIASDRAEMNDRAGDNPEKLAELTAAWAENEARIAERALP